MCSSSLCFCYGASSSVVYGAREVLGLVGGPGTSPGTPRGGSGFLERPRDLPLGGLGTPTGVAQTSPHDKCGGSLGAPSRCSFGCCNETAARTGRRPPPPCPAHVGELAERCGSREQETVLDLVRQTLRKGALQRSSQKDAAVPRAGRRAVPWPSDAVRTRCYRIRRLKRRAAPRETATARRRQQQTKFATA